jgi:alpha-glucoside transport system substrate-binding protein
MRAGADRPHAVVVKASLKSLIWYPPQAFRARGFSPPRTWEELEALTRAAVAGGTPAWCLGLESVSASGWPGTDWIEDILLHESGPAVYQKWIDGDLAWTSPQVRSAWQRWGRLIAAPAAINGGPRSALITSYADAGAPMFHASPGCLMDHQASFIAANYTRRTAADGSAVRSGRDFDVFAFPSIDDRYAGALEVGADLAGTFTGTPEARTLIAYLATPQAQRIWPGQPGSGALSASTAVPPSDYPDHISATMAGMITGRSETGSLTVPPTVSFDASDLMPAHLATAFGQAALEYLAHPQKLPALLLSLDQIRQRTYP